MVSQNTLFTVILFHHLDDGDLYTPPRGSEQENDQTGQNEELVPKRGTTSVVVLSKDPVLRYQVGTKKMKTSRYQVFSSTGSTEYPVNPVLDAYGPMISAMQKTRTESRNPVIKTEFTV